MTANFRFQKKKWNDVAFFENISVFQFDGYKRVFHGSDSNSLQYQINTDGLGFK